MTTTAEHRVSRVFTSGGHRGDLVYVLAHARARALRDGVAFVRGPEGDSISIVPMVHGWDVNTASFFTPTWMDQVVQILAQYGQEGA